MIAWCVLHDVTLIRNVIVIVDGEWKWAGHLQEKLLVKLNPDVLRSKRNQFW